MKRSDLLEKLNLPARKAVELAMKSAKLRGNPHVELVHWIEQLALTDNGDIQKISRHFELDLSRLTAHLTRAIDELPRGASSINDLSEHIFEAIHEGLVVSLGMKAASVRSGHVLLAALADRDLRPFLNYMSPEFAKIRVQELEAGFPGIVAGSLEDGASAGKGEGHPGAASGAMPAPAGAGSALETYATDLTAEAEAGKMDPIVGRDEEIRRMVDILMRRRQNNPILTGEAGVGKTAVVEGFAQRLARGDIPPQLQNIRLLALDIGLLQAGASMKGEFEDRLRRVIDEVQSAERPIILFIDEAHTLIGAGGAAGTGDAANLLKPALARGELRTIAATTWAEYKKHIEKDPALTRRFEVVKVEEPSEEKALLMIRGVAGSLEAHHRIQILDEALEAAVQLSSRYVPARQLPDKAVALLDTACARVAVSQHAVPAEVEDVRRRIAGLEVEQGILRREAEIGIDRGDRAEAVSAALAAAAEELTAAEARWADEKALVDEILAIRAKLRTPPEPPEGFEPLSDEARTALAADLAEKMAALAAAQGERPLILPSVDRQAVATVVQDWTGIPLSRMGADEVATVLNLPATLAERVVGQDHAMEMIARRIQTSRAGLTAPEKPVGVFLLAGPSGTGKTETALALAEALYGGEQNLITINMSEFQEAHTVSTLKGAPPGYVGYGEGGVLTEAVRRRPYSVVLLDEVEKAHPDVHEIFFQVFDKGTMEDGEGRRIDFKNTLILLTSNVGSDLIMSMCEDPDLAPGAEALAKALRKPLLEVFPPALLGRLVTIPYYPLSDEMIRSIASLKLNAIRKRVATVHGAELICGDDVLELIRSRCAELESGGRMIDAILTNTMLPAISREVLVRMGDGEAINTIRVSINEGEFCMEMC